MECSATIMKILLLNMLLAFAVHADTSLPPSYSPEPSSFTDDSSPEPSASDDSTQPLPVPEVSPPSPETVIPPPMPLPAPLLPQPPPLPQYPPPREVDPVAPPPMTCKDLCLLKCSRKHGFRRYLCIGKCLGLCKIFSPNAGYQCTRDCVMDNLHHQPDIKSLDGLVNTCYNSCSKNA